MGKILNRVESGGASFEKKFRKRELPTPQIIGHATIDDRDEARNYNCGRVGHVEASCGAVGVVQTAQPIMQCILQKLK